MQGAPISSRIAASKTITPKGFGPSGFFFFYRSKMACHPSAADIKNPVRGPGFRGSSVELDFFQLGIRRDQPLDAFAVKGDLHATLRTAAFKVNDGAFAKFRV